MKNLIVVMLVLMFSSAFTQDVQYRISESSIQQKKLEHMQGGILLRFDHQIKQRENFDGKRELSWVCKELWIAPNTYPGVVKAKIAKIMPTASPLLLNGLESYYSQKSYIDTLLIENYKRQILAYKKTVQRFKTIKQKVLFNKKLITYLRKQ